jgi:putative peptidoglycan lipid II flippase
MTKKFTSTVAGASILLTGVGLLSRGLGLVREMVFASSFGLSKEYDLFLVGTVIPLTLNTIVLYIAQNYFIPVYNRLKTNSIENAQTFTLRSIFMFSLGGLVLMSVLYYFSPQIISLYVDHPLDSELTLPVQIFRIYSITIPLNAAFSILAAYLYAEFEFKFPSFSQLFLNISVIIIVVFFADKLGVTSIPIGYLVGTLFQLGFLLFYVFRFKIKLSFIKSGNEKYFYWDSGIIMILVIESLSQIYLISDRYFLTSVEKGGIAALNYSMNLFFLPVSIISVALSTALFSSFSKLFVEKNLNEIKDKLSNFFSINLYLFIPITFVFFFFGDIIITILFQRGSFTAADSAMTFETLKYFTLSLIFYSCYSVLNKLLYSIEMIKQLLVITVIGCSIKVIFNFLLVPYLKQDGLALSSSISYIFFFCASLILIKYELHLNIRDFLTNDFILIISNSLLAILISGIFINQLLQLIEKDFDSMLLQLILFVLIYLINSLIIDRSRIRLFLRNFNI